MTSGKRAKAKRREDESASDPRATRADRAKFVRAVATQVRTVDFSTATSSESRVAVGWVLAALAQGITIVDSEDAGNGQHLAPNRRLLFELAVNLEGLNRRGQPLIDALARKAQNEASKAIQTLGSDWFPGGTNTGGSAIVASSGDTSSDNLSAFKALAQHLGLTNGFYGAWLAETWLSHAGVRLAEAYARVSHAGVYGSSPSSTEPDLAIVGVLVWHCVALAAEIIEREGHVEVAIALRQVIGDEYGLW